MFHDPFSDRFFIRQQVRHEELLAMAEERRRMSQIHSTGVIQKYRCQLLTRLGENLVSLGVRLQDRYSAASEISAPKGIRS